MLVVPAPAVDALKVLPVTPVPDHTPPAGDPPLRVTLWLLQTALNADRETEGGCNTRILALPETVPEQLGPLTLTGVYDVVDVGDTVIKCGVEVMETVWLEVPLL